MKNSTLFKNGSALLANTDDVNFEDNPVIVCAEPFAEPEIKPSFNCTVTENRKRSAAYMAAGAPFGMAEMLAKEDRDIERRIFLLDNSGSTSEPDGHVVTCVAGGSYQSVRATRWQEIHAMASDQAKWNAQTGTRSEFYLLNPPCPLQPKEGRDFVVIDPKQGDVRLQVASLEQMLEQTTPHGTTPLTDRLRLLRARLRSENTDGRRIMLSIVTDGLPTAAQNVRCTERDKQEYVEELRTFANSFNAFVVIRLCTDDDATVSYYNAVDEELELPLDILDDLRGEACELYFNGNGWLAYSPLIHRIREGGTIAKVFDLLDERALKPVEIAMFLELILRGPEDEPFPRSPKELFELAKRIVPRAPLVYNGRLGRMTPPVDLKLLKKALGRTSWARAKSVPAQMFRSLRGLVSQPSSRNY